MGDSYVWMFLLQNMAESFSELLFIHYLDLDQVYYLSTVIDPDVIILTGQGYPAIWTLSQLTAKILTAEIVSQNTPPTMVTGKAYDITIVVKNTGNQSWSEDDQIRLGIFPEGKESGYRVFLPEGVTVEPGQDYAFELKNYQASGIASTYIEFQMLQEGFQYFGEKERVDFLVK